MTTFEDVKKALDEVKVSVETNVWNAIAKYEKINRILDDVQQMLTEAKELAGEPNENGVYVVEWNQNED